MNLMHLIAEDINGDGELMATYGKGRFVFDDGSKATIWRVSQRSLAHAMRGYRNDAVSALGSRRATGREFVLSRIYTAIDLERPDEDLPGEWRFNAPRGQKSSG